MYCFQDNATDEDSDESNSEVELEDVTTDEESAQVP